jgi:hypothetical protein
LSIIIAQWLTVPSLFSSPGTQANNGQFRDMTEAEVIEAIRTVPWHPADNGRIEGRKDYAFDSAWNRRHYAMKQVGPIFVEEPTEIVVVTV